MRSEDNPPNRFERAHLEREPGDELPAELTVYEERASSILASNDSPDLSFRYSANPYRGCFHGCAYCYARPSHPYLGFGAGTDFERRIVVKVNAPELLAKAFEARGWSGSTVVLSGNTDPYQPLEARYGLTRGLLEVALAYRNPIGVITKGATILRDVPLLAELAREARVVVTVSCAFDDDAMARALDPFAPPPSKRFEMMRVLAEAGVPVAVSLAPTIPGLNDSQIPRVLERAREAGATSAFHTLVRLAGEVAPIFEARLREAYPERADKILRAIREMHGGALHDPRFGHRMRGEGPRYGAVERLFDVHAKRLGFGEHRFAWDEAPTTFARPTAQLRLPGLG